MYFSRQVLIFIIIGLITVLIDYLTYRCLFFFFSNVNIAKSIGFAFGSIFSFVTNRKITFNIKEHFSIHLIKFTLLYLNSMLINVFVNSILLELLIKSNLKVQISFIFATIISATINFIGMKYVVFK